MYGLDAFDRPELKHQAADTLLQLKAKGLEQRPVDDNIPVLIIEQKPDTLSKFVEDQLNEDFI